MWNAGSHSACTTKSKSSIYIGINDVDDLLMMVPLQDEIAELACCTGGRRPSCSLCSGARVLRRRMASCRCCTAIC